MMDIRKGRPEDETTLAEFQVLLAEESEHIALDPMVVQKGVRAVFDDPARGSYWVAESDGAIVGCLLTVPEWSDWRNGTVLWIHSVYVTPSARRLGVFRAMYNRLKREVTSSDNLRGLRLYVEKENERAQKVYEAMGMAATRYDLFEWMREGW
ncbi:MAG: GNAT family N-acetyltransferase [bacterium]|jgi:GNAT superfamily N-acetyltransferase|nr:GNAT family N-acetyltransferase [bacterium]